MISLDVVIAGTDDGEDAVEEGEGVEGTVEIEVAEGG